ncbi:ethylbenzene dehydrogenase-related protein [Desulfonatronum thioautotrophicum]|uniref:ethylbenzene dehydrogenase-related protein n=1 Tax=Desulfonatronum thioautotrophicum TaxID=617001 RepID=UPI0005EB4E07|nr:ethylbenzene dehydrogenase-related protein [Desulfonatronum thioautotrophicum]
MISMKMKILAIIGILSLAVVLFGCEDPRMHMVGDRAMITDPDAPVLGVEVRAAMDQERIALNFRWESSKEFAGQFHDLVGYDGEKWERLRGAQGIDEDRLSIMFEDPRRPIKGFANTGCYAACHVDLRSMPETLGDSRHYVLAETDADVDAFGLDMWHWRGGRSGPMGYAEDTYISKGKFGTVYNGRKRDSLGSPPTNWVRERGDRQREDQPLHIGEWNGAGLPRFVFNPNKVSFGNYFLADEAGRLINSREQLTAITTMDFIPLKVIYQDLDFDPVDKTNAVDVLYLLFLANDMERPNFRPGWEEYWAEQLGVHTAEEAVAMLDDIVAKMEPGALITRSVGFIYDSSQHDIVSERDFDFVNNIWNLTLYRDLSTGFELVDDVDLAGLLGEIVYNMAFAVHDISAGRLWHHISFPYTLGNAESHADIKAIMVDEVSSVDWSGIEPLKSALYLPGQVSLQHLTSPDKHRAGASFLLQLRCQNCHTLDDIHGVANKSRQFHIQP